MKLVSACYISEFWVSMHEKKIKKTEKTRKYVPFDHLQTPILNLESRLVRLG